MSDTPRIAFLASTTEAAQMARAAMLARYGDHAPDQADVLCPLGGDGFMLQTLHRHGRLGKPVFGMKLGTVGFLMNQYRAEDDVVARIARAEPANLRPLEMVACWWPPRPAAPPTTIRRTGPSCRWARTPSR